MTGVFIVGASERCTEEGASPATLWKIMSRTQGGNYILLRTVAKGNNGKQFKSVQLFIRFLSRFCFQLINSLITLVGFLLSLFLSSSVREMSAEDREREHNRRGNSPLMNNSPPGGAMTF